MAKYLLLIYGNERIWEAMSEQELADLDAALALARLLPEVSAAHSGVEVRPVNGPSQTSPEQVGPALSTYGYLSAARADFLRQFGRWAEAATSYEEALAMTGNEVERAFLARRLEEVTAHLD